LERQQMRKWDTYCLLLKRQVYLHLMLNCGFDNPEVLAIRIGGQACINIYRWIERNLASIKME